MASLFYGLAAAGDTPDSILIQAASTARAYEFEVKNTAQADGAGNQIRMPDAVRSLRRIIEYIARQQAITAFTGVNLGDSTENVATGAATTGKDFELTAATANGAYAALQAARTIKKAIVQNGEQW